MQRHVRPRDRTASTPAYRITLGQEFTTHRARVGRQLLMPGPPRTPHSTQADWVADLEEVCQHTEVVPFRAVSSDLSHPEDVNSCRQRSGRLRHGAEHPRGSQWSASALAPPATSAPNLMLCWMFLKRRRSQFCNGDVTTYSILECSL
eukprot:3332621-Rhodomonas_salina.2